MKTRRTPTLLQIKKIKPLWYYWDQKLNKYYGSFTSTLKIKSIELK